MNTVSKIDLNGSYLYRIVAMGEINTAHSTCGRKAKGSVCVVVNIILRKLSCGITWFRTGEFMCPSP